MSRRPYLSLSTLLLFAALIWFTGALIEWKPALLETQGGNSELANLKRLASRFGQGETAMLVVEAEPREVKSTTLFTPQNLAELRQLTKDFEKSGQCLVTVGLLTVPFLTVTPDETQMTTLMPELPTSDADALSLRAKAWASPAVAHQLLSADGKSTLLLCPLVPNRTPSSTPLVSPTSGGVDQSLHRLVELVGQRKHERLALTWAGGLSVAPSLAHDLKLGGTLIFAMAWPLALIVSWFEYRRGRAFKLWAAGLCLPLALLTLAFGLYTLDKAPGPFSLLIGRTTAAAGQAIDRVTGSDDSLLIDVNADVDHTEGLYQLAKYCSNLEQAQLGQVFCPTLVFQQMAAAMVGETSLPHDDAQLKALWFFAKDRAEVRSLLTPDHQHALIRLLLINPGESAAARAEVLDRAQASQLKVEVAGMTLTNNDVRKAVLPSVFLVVIGAAISWWMGRGRIRTSVPLGIGWFASAIVCAPFGFLSLQLLTLSAWALFASLAENMSENSPAQT